MPTHVPVLVNEVLAALEPAPGQTYLDCTAGLGGHAAAIARRLVPGGRVILNDADPANLSRAAAGVRAVSHPSPASELAGAAPTVVELHGNFAEAPRKMCLGGFSADLMLADLGFSSNQMGDPARGLSFMAEGPLDMRLNPDLTLTAADLVNSLPERELAGVIAEFGEEPAAARIARKLVQERRAAPITTTSRLADLVRSACPPRHPRAGIDPTTKTFQALRIAVNDELGSLDALLAMVSSAAGNVASGKPTWLCPGARVAVISFHSLEDRRVKQAFQDLQARGLAAVLTPAPITPGEHELADNPRSRSAKLRAIRFARASKNGPGAV